ncbi:MAG: cobalamin-dependent protein, partial [Candidatus Paceibacteria bacterium]
MPISSGVIPPLGVMYLAAVEREKFPEDTINIWDLRVDKKIRRNLREYIKQFDPDIIGISAITYEAQSMHKIASIAKSVKHDV